MTVTKHKTTVMIEDSVWQNWVLFVVQRTGSARKLSEEMERALSDYMLANGAQTQAIAPRVQTAPSSFTVLNTSETPKSSGKKKSK